MEADRWQRLEAVFDGASARPPADRVAFVDAACADDTTLRDEVLQLLAASEQASRFLATPALDHLAHQFAADGRSLRPGERVGAYVVGELIGCGGGGEVWRARDERLGRDVAIKVLPPVFTTDRDRIERFADEARAAGTLNHPNVLTVHDVGEHCGMPYLVTEYLTGQSLRKRLASRRLAADDAVSIAIGVARGLAAAHRLGVVHRDLKPDNVFVSNDGVKILDFGLATLQAATDADSGTAVADGLVGTVGYMSPEQLSGLTVDARADLFALGVTLHEMLTGQRPFTGTNDFEVLHAVLHAEPPVVTSLNSEVRPALATIVSRLLRKSPDARFHSAADVAWALEQVPRAEPTVSPSLRESASGPRHAAAWALALLLLTATGVGVLWSRRPEAPVPGAIPLTEFTWSLPEGVRLDSAPVVSPDGRRMVFAGRDGSNTRLYLRDLSSPTPIALDGTPGAQHPFWSPDGRAVGFFADGALMKLRLEGGSPTRLADARDGRGGTWSRTNVIVFAPDILETALLKVSADGGPVTAATVLDRANGENSHRWPAFLADGVHFVFYARSSDDARRGIALGRADREAAPPHTLLMRSDNSAVVVADPDASVGHLVYVNDGRVEARRFDPGTGRLDDAVTLGWSAAAQTARLPSMVSAATDVLAFVAPTSPPGVQLSSVLRDGGDLRVGVEVATQNWPRLSPDGRSLASQRIDTVRGTPDLWVDDLVRGVRLRVTSAREAEALPIWSPDGLRLAYITSNSPPRTPGDMKIVVAASDGTSVEATIPCPGVYCETTDWTPDGRLLVNVRSQGVVDVWAVPTRGDRPRPLLDAPYAERDARVSPNGRWVAYVSEENGQPEVAVRTLAGPVSRTVVSAGGGNQPVWRRDGTELFFVNASGRLSSVAVRESADGTPDFAAGTVLDVPPIGFGHFGTQYDVSPDGRRIYFLRAADGSPAREIGMVMGWRARLAPR